MMHLVCASMKSFLEELMFYSMIYSNLEQKVFFYRQHNVDDDCTQWWRVE